MVEVVVIVVIVLGAVLEVAVGLVLAVDEAKVSACSVVVTKTSILQNIWTCCLQPRARYHPDFPSGAACKTFFFLGKRNIQFRKKLYARSKFY